MNSSIFWDMMPCSPKKTELFITTAVRTSNPTFMFHVSIFKTRMREMLWLDYRPD
jgi:hypothetical protein